MDKQKPELIQEREYLFPYHYIPHEDNGAWKIYRDLWWGYDYIANLETILRLAISYNPKKVLDFGCGDGRLIYELALQGVSEVYGVDISERALYLTKAMLPSHYNGINTYKSIKEIPESKFDVVIAMEVLEHIKPEELQPTLKDIYNVMHDDSVFIVSVPTTNIPINPKHYKHFTLHDLEEAVKGLFIIKESFFICKSNRLSKWIRRITINRFFILNWHIILRLVTNVYKHFILNANESSGSHLIAVLQK